MREVSLGQIAYEAYWGKHAGDYTRQHPERWQQTAEAVLAAAREREAGLAALIERLQGELEWQREALDCGYYRYPNGKVSCQECGRQATEQSAIQHTDECAFGHIERALSLTPTAALDDLRRRERVEVLNQVMAALDGQFTKEQHSEARGSIWTALKTIGTLRADAIAAERAGEGGAA